MDRLLELLARIAALVEGAANPDRPLAESTSDELDALVTELREAYSEVRAGELDAAAMDVLDRAGQAVQLVIAEENTRELEAEANQARAAELDALVLPSAQDEPEPEPEAEPEPTPEPEAEPEPAPAPEPETAPEPEHVAVEVMPIAAAARPRVPLARLRERTPVAARPVARPADEDRARVIAAAGLPNVAAGGEFSSSRELADAFIQVWDANASAAGDGVQVAVARVQGNYPEDRRVSSAWAAPRNTEVFRAGIDAWQQDSLTAAGGICAPTVPYYEQAMVSQSARPIRDGLPSFQADRGGINWIAPPTLASITTTGGSAAIGQVTAAQDAANATKTKQFISCGAANSAQIYAVTNILEFGNMMGRTFPELVQAWVGLAEAAFARFAENLLLSAITTGSTAVTTVQVLGVARDILNAATLAAVAYRNRHRMDPQATLVAMFPEWLVGAIQSDIWSAFNTGDDEANTVTKALINAWFASRNIRVIWFQDGVGPGNPGAQIFPAQAAGALTRWPTVCQWYLFHEGAWIVLDGGSLDLGIVRDSTLNAANKYQMFYEGFENVVFVGVESLRIRSTICVNGGTAGTIDPNTICDGGS